MTKPSDVNATPQIENLTAGRQHQARARVEAEAFEAALLDRISGPVEQGLARTAATFYFAVRTYHWRRMARARRRDKELAEAVAAGNALERLLERLRMIPANADKPTTSQSSAVEAHPRRTPYCECKEGASEVCQQCKKRLATKPAEGSAQ